MTKIEIVVTVIGSIITVTSGMYGFYKWAYRRGQRDINNIRKRSQLTEVYAPLRQALMDMYITSGYNTQYPCRTQRIRRAWQNINYFHFLEGIRILFNRGRGCWSSEVEFGQYPISTIRNIAIRHPDLAEPYLLELLQNRERAILENSLTVDDPIEENSDNNLSGTDMEIIDHIINKYKQLSNRLNL